MLFADVGTEITWSAVCIALAFAGIFGLRTGISALASAISEWLRQKREEFDANLRQAAREKEALERANAALLAMAKENLDRTSAALKELQERYTEDRLRIKAELESKDKRIAELENQRKA